jgi:epoxyqueuosine reductase
LDRAELTGAIKDRAWELGFDAVGIAPAEAVPPERLSEWLKRGFQGEMGYMERNSEARLDPARVLSPIASVISAAVSYLHPHSLPYDDPSRAVISRYAAGEDYHQVLLEKFRGLVDHIQELQPGVQTKSYVDTGPVMEKYWASRAGIGWIGKHTNLISRRLGSWVFLGEVLLDVELDYDLPAADHCGSCTRCIDACPTEAIVEPYVLDSRRCISYLTIELREDIPPEFRPSLGNLVYGCDICQDVCPWNRKAGRSTAEALASRPENEAPDLRELARLSPQEFSRRFRGSPVKRTKWRGLMRNVAVALGNSGSPETKAELEALLHCEDAMVRRHAAWALLQLAPGEEERAELESICSEQ